jgi:hypothetical protein
MEPDVQAAEDAEVRLRVRGVERRVAFERRDRRRRLLPWLLCPLALPVLGAAAFVAVVQSAGGDLRSWSAASAVVALASCLGVPGVVSGWIGRWHGRVEAVMWAALTVAVELALVFGIGFAALGLGP